jgi:hypothetical protein
MRFVTAFTITCRKSSKEHRHYISFSIFYERKRYVVYYEQFLNDNFIESFEIATLFSEKLARSFVNKLFLSINNNLEKFDIEKVGLK